MKKTHALYTIISLCALTAYLGYLVKGSISDVDTIEETLPYALDVAIATESATTQRVLPVSETATEEVFVDDIFLPTEPATEIDGFSPVYPVRGEILATFSLRHTFNAASGDWRAHGGIDIKAAEGTEVCAIEDGAVIEVYSNPVWGKVIKIDHGEYVSIYKNLADINMVKTGDNVTRGQVISHVGASSPLEAELPGHLHFELTHYGDSIDPIELLG